MEQNSVEAQDKARSIEPFLRLAQRPVQQRTRCHKCDLNSSWVTGIVTALQKAVQFLRDQQFQKRLGGSWNPWVPHPRAVVGGWEASA